MDGDARTMVTQLVDVGRMKMLWRLGRTACFANRRYRDIAGSSCSVDCGRRCGCSNKCFARSHETPPDDLHTPSLHRSPRTWNQWSASPTWTARTSRKALTAWTTAPRRRRTTVKAKACRSPTVRWVISLRSNQVRENDQTTGKCGNESESESNVDGGR